jgi:hypothetical protein
VKRWVAVLLLAICAFGVRPARADEETRARKLALDVAGAFSNDGFKIRDGHWDGPVKPNERTLIAVNLYAGNQYWFSAGAAEPAKKVAVEIFDETGRQVMADGYNEGSKAAAGFSPPNSGQYFVSLAIAEGGAANCCLVYSYK